MQEVLEFVLVLLAVFVVVAVILSISAFAVSQCRAAKRPPALQPARESGVLLSHGTQRSHTLPEFMPLAPKTPYDTHLNLDPALRVAYVTDVEGNWEFFLAYISRCKGLRLVGMDEGGSCARVDLADGWRLIFGGDACDKGGAVGGSIRVLKSLLLLKRRYPSRVTLLLGNRDLNKMRLTSELDAGELDAALLEHLPGPYWVPAAKRVTPSAFLRKRVAAQFGVEPAEVSDGQLQAANTIANRLRYILTETMGADGELERRAAELDEIAAAGTEEARAAIVALTSSGLAAADGGGSGGGGEQQPEVESASIERAVASFRVAAGAGGIYREYIAHGEMGVLVGSNLFLHGGLVSGAGFGDDWPAETTSALGHVPGRPERVENVLEWLRALCAWKEAQVGAWLREPTWHRAAGAADAYKMYSANGGDGGGDAADAAAAVKNRVRGGEGLMAYVVPGTGPSVVMARHLESPSGMPLASLPTAMMAQLNAQGVHRLIVGHTPHGHCPTVIKSGGVGSGGSGGGSGGSAHLEVVMGDTSYSDMKAPDMRGAAVPDVVLLPDGTCTVGGVLPDWTEYAYTLGAGMGTPGALVGALETLPEAASPPSPIDEAPPSAAGAGRRFVKTWVPSRSSYVLCRMVNGFTCEYSEAGAEETARLVAASSA